jgi:hypothetical protein
MKMAKPFSLEKRVLSFAKGSLFARRGFGYAAPQMSIDSLFTPFDDIVYREETGKKIVMPRIPGIDKREDERYALNKPGRGMWGRYTGTSGLLETVIVLKAKNKALIEEIEQEGAENFFFEFFPRRMPIAIGYNGIFWQSGGRGHFYKRGQG